MHRHNEVTPNDRLENDKRSKEFKLSIIWKRNFYFNTRPNGIFDPNFSSVLSNDPMHNRKAKACARLLGGVKGVKDVGKVLFCYAAACVGDGYLNTLAIHLYPRNADFTAIRHSLDAIQQKVQKGLF